MRPPARRIARGLTALAAALLGACFDFDATTAGGPLTDAGPTKPDGGLDASVTDGSVPIGPGDASYCASIPASSGVLFCDDFDEDPLPGSWSSRHEIGGALTETDASAASLPTSLDEKTNVLALFDPIDVSLRKQPFSVPPFPATLRFGFSLEPVQIDTSAQGAIVLGAVDFLDGNGSGNRYSVELAINVQNGAPALVLGEQSGFKDGGAPYVPHPLPPSQPLAMNAWSNLVVQVDWTSATTAQGSVTVNGGQELAPVTLTMTVQATSLQIGIGTSYVNEPSPGWELRYDNVWFSMK